MTAKVPASDDPDNTGLYGGIVLGLAAIAALVVANSPFGPAYEALLRTTGEEQPATNDQNKYKREIQGVSK